MFVGEILKINFLSGAETIITAGPRRVKSARRIYDGSGEAGHQFVTDG